MIVGIFGVIGVREKGGIEDAEGLGHRGSLSRRILSVVAKPHLLNIQPVRGNKSYLSLSVCDSPLDGTFETVTRVTGMLSPWAFEKVGS